MQQQLINFLMGSGGDDRGRRITEIIRWNDGQLESCHDYIQWVFPNRTRSQYNRNAPILDDEIVQTIINSPQAISNVRQMLMRMYSFYSLEVTTFDDGTYQLDPRSFTPWWVTPNNHNYLRLTRILTTLKHLDLHEDMYALSDILEVLGSKNRQLIGEKTLQFWAEACD